MQKNYIKPMSECNLVRGESPIAGSLERPGGVIDDIQWDEGENVGGDNDNPGGFIDEFEWE